MAKKKANLPKNFDELLEAGDMQALKDVFTKCELDARGGYGKSTALGFSNIPDELVRWLVRQGADINAADTYKCTPLHSQAKSWRGNVSLFLDSGANIEARDSDDDTPLHAAAGAFRTKAVRELVAHGANVLAENNRKLTPLAKALANCQNAHIVDMAEIARILLDAGTPVTQEMKKSVERIGETFEFYKANFNKEHLSQTVDALSYLYRQFDVTPAESRHMHDGISPIAVTATGWAAQHAELWNYLIPGQGYAKTVQGEVIRITGRVSHEILDNGAMNWDGHYKKMLDALIRFFKTGVPLEADELQEAITLVKRIRGGDGDDEPARLSELAVHWVLANPDPVPMTPPDYER